jgi:hypothetical protein
VGRGGSGPAAGLRGGSDDVGRGGSESACGGARRAPRFPLVHSLLYGSPAMEGGPSGLAQTWLASVGGAVSESAPATTPRLGVGSEGESGRSGTSTNAPELEEAGRGRRMMVPRCGVVVCVQVIYSTVEASVRAVWKCCDWSRIQRTTDS